MKIKKILLFNAVLITAAFLAACEKDGDHGRNTNLDVPELTESNTIQFTATVQAGNYVYVILDGGKIAVDWGDGQVTKDINPGSGDVFRMEFTHVYKTTGEYCVRIWSDELTFINLSSLLHSYGRLHVGNCPVLKNAVFNSFPDDVSLNLNGCKNLETLNLGNWEKLETVALNECSQLKEIAAYTNPNLKTFDVSGNGKLHTLDFFDSGLEELWLPQDITNVNVRGNKNLKSISLIDYKNLVTLNCTGNEKLTTLALDGCDNLSYLDFSDTQVESFDFSGFPSLVYISCSDSKMTNIDVSGNRELGNLYCSGLGLTSLDISNNTALRVLDCSDNMLTALDVSENTRFRVLYINGNQLDKDALETVFSALQPFDLSTPSSPSEIKIYGNPGVGTCNTKIITDKKWVIKTN